MSDTSNLKNVIDPSTKKSLSLANLTCDELIELIQSGINKYPKFVALVSTAISNADARVHLASIKPLPAVNYERLHRKFRRKLHSLDRCGDFQQDDISELGSDLDKIIDEVESSVNKTSHLDTVEDAFICLKQFADEMPGVSRILYEDLVHHQGHVLDSIGYSMVEVGTLLREKGGPKGKGNNIKWEIERWAYGHEFDGAEFLFPQVLEAVWGKDKKETKSNGKKSEDGQKAIKGVQKGKTSGSKRSHEDTENKANEKGKRVKV